ncbi:hypothetical protein [Flavobacterium sp. W22_SRS_FP1]|uniref:hypothetical protein n=1 Tax=Flavobacterium sp. W22_SRS_FP1 TaxID=3240276 RepID=UPI003F9254DF
MKLPNFSEPTSGSHYLRECYAFIVKTAKLKKTRSTSLEKTFLLEIKREAFYCIYKYNDTQFTVVNFHAVPKTNEPKRAINYLKILTDGYSTLNLIFVGDFNCRQYLAVFKPSKKIGYKSILVGQNKLLKIKVQKQQVSDLRV